MSDFRVVVSLQRKELPCRNEAGGVVFGFQCLPEGKYDERWLRAITSCIRERLMELDEYEPSKTPPEAPWPRYKCEVCGIWRHDVFIVPGYGVKRHMCLECRLRQEGAAVEKDAD